MSTNMEVSLWQVTGEFGEARAAGRSQRILTVDIVNNLRGSHCVRFLVKN